MRGIVVFIGGPLDEKVQELPELLPVYICPVKDRVYSLGEEEGDMSKVSYGELRYLRTRQRRSIDGVMCAVYEVDL